MNKLRLPNDPPLKRRIALGSPDKVKQCLSDDVNAHLCCDEARRSPWLLAVQLGDIAKAEILYEVRQNDGESLFFATINDQAAMLQWLLDKGFDPNATNDFSNTLLMEACDNSAVNCIKVLLASG